RKGSSAPFTGLSAAAVFGPPLTAGERVRALLRNPVYGVSRGSASATSTTQPGRALPNGSSQTSRTPVNGAAGVNPVHRSTRRQRRAEYRYRGKPRKRG